MIHTIVATNQKGDSVELDLADPWAGGIAVVGASGLGPSEGTVNMVDFATSDGSLFNSSRIQSREIELGMTLRRSGIGSSGSSELSTRSFWTSSPIPGRAIL